MATKDHLHFLTPVSPQWRLDFLALSAILWGAGSDNLDRKLKQTPQGHGSTSLELQFG